MRKFKALPAVLSMLLLAMLAMPAFASLATPTGIFGYVRMDGSPVDGATVRLSDGQTAMTDSQGHYVFSSSVYNGSAYSIVASYKGLSALTTFTAQGDRMEIDLSLAAPSATGTGETSNSLNPLFPSPIPSASVSSNNTSVGEQGTPQYNHTLASGSTSVNNTNAGTQADEGESIDEPGSGAGFETGNMFFLMGGLAILLALSGAGFYLLWRER